MISNASNGMQIHLGCGKRYIPGFVHIDLADFPHIDYRRRIDSLPMFDDETVDLIYCSHALEYFDRIEALLVLAEWYRVLRKGGLMRLAVPDFEALAKVYNTHDHNLDLILGPLYGRMEIEGNTELIYHKTIYDFESLKKTLEKAAFVDIRRFEWRDTVHKDFDDYSQAYIPHMDKENGILISLNVEAKK